MKLQHLAIGDRFEYEGRIFVKTGPLTASSDQGGQQMIPRYAMLKPLGATPPAGPGATVRTLQAATVLAAFDAFVGQCRPLVRPEDQPALDAARQRFLDALG